jgi:WD40 repeat protein
VTTHWKFQDQDVDSIPPPVIDATTGHPMGRTTVVTGQRTPWIIVARDRDQIHVSKLVDSKLEPSSRLETYVEENIFLALSGDERHLIVAHNAPDFAIQPQDVLPPPPPAPPPPAGNPSEVPPPLLTPIENPPPPPSSGAAARSVRPSWWISQFHSARINGAAGSVAGLVHSLVPMILLQPADVVEPRPEQPPAPIPPRLQPLLRPPDRQNVAPPDPAGKTESPPEPNPDPGQPLVPTPDQPPVPVPEQPVIPSAVTGGEAVGGLNSGPTRPAYISSFELASRTLVKSMDLGLGTIASFSSCHESGLVFAAGGARMTVFLRCEGGNLGQDSVWFPVEREITAASSAADGRRFVTIEGKRLRLWRRDGREYASQLNCRSDLWCDSQLTNGKVDWALVYDREGGEVRLVDWEAGRELARFHHLAASAVAASATGSAVATVDNRGQLRVYRFERDTNGLWVTSPLALAPSAETYAWSNVAISADGRWIITGGYQSAAGVYRLVNNQYEFHRFIGPRQSFVHNLALSKTGSVVAIAYMDHCLRLFDYENGELLADTSFGSHAKGMSFSHDGSLLACGSLSGSASLLDGRTLEHRASLTSENVAWSTTFSSSSNRLAVGHRDGTIAVWDVASRLRLTQWRGHEFGVTELTFADDGSLVSCDFRGTVRRWNLRAVRRELDRLGLVEERRVDF